MSSSQLRRRAFKTHMLVAAIGFVMLMISSAILYTVSYYSTKLAVESNPALVEVKELKTHISESLVAVRGWIVIEKESFLDDRNRAWNDGVYANIKTLKTIGTHAPELFDAAHIDRIAALARRLDEWQWQICDVAQSPGNNPAQVLYVQEAQPLFAEIDKGLSALLKQETGEQGLARASVTAMRRYIVQMELNLVRYNHDRQQHDYDNYKHIVQAVNDTMQTINSTQNTTVEYKALVQWTCAKIQSVQLTAQQIFKKRHAEDGDVAQHILKHQAIPLVEALFAEIAPLAESLTTRSRADVMALSMIARIGRWTPWLIAVLVLTLFAVASVVSSRSARNLIEPISQLALGVQGMEQGNFNFELDADNEGELADLMNQFKVMRDSIQANQELLTIKNTSLKEQHRLLTNSNEDLAQFAYIASHDLKSPLRAIGSLIDFIQEDLEDAGIQLPDDVQVHFSTIGGRVQRMEGLISGLLNYAIVDAEEDTSETFSLTELMQEVVGDTDKKPTMIFNFPSTDTGITGNRLMLGQVLSNLVSNAAKYHDRDDGIITISHERSATDPSQIQISVSDDGPGIDPKSHEKIFQIFQTLQARDTFESTGIGLALVRKLVRVHGGDVTVTSDGTSGTTFSFIWPINENTTHIIKKS